MKRFVLTLALTCALYGSALAGDLPTCGVMSPQPSETTQTTVETLPGNIPSDSCSDQLSGAAFSVLLTVLGLLAV